MDLDGRRGGEDLGGAEGGETIIGKQYVRKKNLFSVKEKKEKSYFLEE